MLGGLSLEDGSVDEYLNTELDESFFEEKRASIQAEIDALKQRKEDIQKRMPNAVVSGITKEIQELESQLD